MAMLVQRKLCPFCDEPLPTRPSRALLASLEAAESQSIPAPSSQNPDHREARILVYIGICPQHCAETKLEADASSSCWPPVDFGAISGRLTSLMPQLHRLLESPGGHQLYDELVADVRAGQALEGIAAARVLSEKRGCG